MNLATRGIEGNIAHGDTFHNDRHPDLKADFILANPPFNVSDWGGERLREDRRWKFGIPPVGNANFAWVQHMIYHLAPNGIAGFVLANGSMSSNQSGEGEIRKNIIEADLVDCMVALPGQLFYSTQILACLWFIARNKKNSKYRDRRREVLFIDARKMGRMVDRTHRELTDEDIRKIADTYHAWRTIGPHPASGHPLPVGEGWGEGVAVYRDIPCFCKRRQAFPDMQGLSPRNLKYMRAFAAAWPNQEIVQEVLAQITCYHNIALLDKLKNSETCGWYVRSLRN